MGLSAVFVQLLVLVVVAATAGASYASISVDDFIAQARKSGIGTDAAPAAVDAKKQAGAKRQAAERISDGNLKTGMRRHLRAIADDLQHLADAADNDDLMRYGGRALDPLAHTPCHHGGMLNCDPDLRRRFRWDDYVGTNDGATSSHDAPFDYCLIGAGPGGLQLARLLEGAGRHFIVFERGNVPGDFYQRYPKHRKLISINKRHTGNGNPEFNRRHDWNSLLNATEEGTAHPHRSRTPLPRAPPFTAYSPEFFPDADRLVDYLGDYAQAVKHRVQFEAEVTRVGRPATPLPANPDMVRATKGSELVHPRGDGFELTVRRGGPAMGPARGPPDTHYCRFVVASTGFYTPAAPNIPGIELAVGYEELPRGGGAHLFEGKRVAVLGNGNSGLEVGTALNSYTAYNQFWSSRPLKLSFFSHYVGDARAVNIGPVDVYQLKSLDGFIDTGGGSFEKNMHITRCYEDASRGNLIVRELGEEGDGEHGHRMKMTKKDKAKKRQRFFTDDGDDGDGDGAAGHGQGDDASADNKRQHPAKWAKRAKRLSDDLSSGGGPGVHGREAFDKVCVNGIVYDAVVRCLGWKFNATAFAPLALKMRTSSKSSRSGKYPAMTCRFASPNQPGFYYNGALTHARDYRRAAGGFIHGYRYNSRAMFRAWEAEHWGLPWEGGRALPFEWGAVAGALLARLSTASGLWQMFGELVDVVQLRYREGKAVYMEEVPRCLCAPPEDQPQADNWMRNGQCRAAPDYGLKHYQLHGIAQRAEKIKEVDIVGHIMNHFSSLPDHGEKMFDPETGAIVNETAWEEALADSRKHAARDFDRGGGALTGHKRPKVRPQRSCYQQRMLDDCAKYDRLVLSFRYRPDFHGEEVIAQDRVGSQEADNAQDSKFLHPVLQFLPAATRDHANNRKRTRIPDMDRILMHVRRDTKKTKAAANATDGNATEANATGAKAVAAVAGDSTAPTGSPWRKATTSDYDDDDEERDEDEDDDENEGGNADPEEDDEDDDGYADDELLVDNMDGKHHDDKAMEQEKKMREEETEEVQQAAKKAKKAQAAADRARAAAGRASDAAALLAHYRALPGGVRPSAGDKWAEPDTLHVCEDLHALWEKEGHHAEPIRHFVRKALRTVVTAEEYAAATESGDLAPMIDRVREAGNTEAAARLMRLAVPGMRVRMRAGATFHWLRPGDAGTLVMAEEDDFPPAYVRWDRSPGYKYSARAHRRMRKGKEIGLETAVGDYELFSSDHFWPVHWEMLELVEGEAARVPELTAALVAHEARLRPALRDEDAPAGDEQDKLRAEVNATATDGATGADGAVATTAPPRGTRVRLVHPYAVCPNLDNEDADGCDFVYGAQKGTLLGVREYADTPDFSLAFPTAVVLWDEGEEGPREGELSALSYPKYVPLLDLEPLYENPDVVATVDSGGSFDFA